MKIKTIQWNIGGGKIRDENADPNKIESYSLEGMDSIAKLLAKFNPDIITLQETHAQEGSVQAETLAEKLELPYFYSDEYDNSHKEEGQRLGQAIIARFPLTSHSFELFRNPKYEIIRPNGDFWISHDKGMTSCVAEVNGKRLTIQTLHLIPFRKFEVDATGEETKQVRDDISQKIEGDTSPYLLQGDFNFDDKSLKDFLPDIFKNDLQEISQDIPTTPKGRRYDHILYRELQLKHYEVIENVLTDHFPIYAEFEL